MFIEKQYYKRQRIVLFILFIALFLFIGYHQFKEGIILWGDGFFHVQRILEIRYAFIHRELPNWLNFQTFFGMGQAINGMYPDISLYPLVLLTMFFSPSHQLAAINILIFTLTLIVTAISLYRRMRVDGLLSIYAAILYSCSGYSLYETVREFQPGVGIIFIFSFPIGFLIKDILTSERFNFKLAIRFTLLITLIMYSHLLSMVVLGLIIFSGYIYLIIIRKFNWYSLVNLFVGGLISILTSLPILYRYFIISSSNIMSPFGQGNIKASSFANMINGVQWDARETLSSLVLIIGVIIFTFWNSRQSNRLLKLGLIELYILLLCTNIFPWRLFNRFPFINNLQYTPWRFGIWLSVIPIIALIVCFQDNQTIKGKLLYILAIISIAMSYVIANDTFKIVQTRLQTENIRVMTTVISFYGSKELNVLNWAEKPDYFPKVTNVVDSKENMTNSRLNEIHHQLIVVGNEKIGISKESINNGVVTIPHKTVTSSDGKVQLPVLGYKSLKYNISSFNHNRLNYGIDKEGYLFIKTRKIQKNVPIEVRFTNPIIYKILVVFSLTALLCTLIVNFNEVKKKYE